MWHLPESVSCEVSSLLLSSSSAAGERYVVSIQLFAHQPHRKSLKGSDKGTLTIPLAAALLYTNIVKVQQGADLNNLKRQDAEKVGTF